MTAIETNDDCWSYCDGILPAVSRSFALIIPRCPEPINRALCVGYLLCRLADTIEDEPNLDRDRRGRLYDLLLAAVDQVADVEQAYAFRRGWPILPVGEYGRLVEGADKVLAAYGTLAPQVREPIRDCLAEMIGGMRKMVPYETHNGIAFFCRDMEDLERYCHYVAGTVGQMSTRLFEMRLTTRGFNATTTWREDGRRLGLGLQMTNIIKDCKLDADRHVSYLPAGCIDFRQAHYELLHIGRADLIGRCIGHLDAGFRYAAAVPADEAGIRTFLLGSLLPAIATLEVAASGTHDQPKIDRAKMAEIFGCIERNLGDNLALKAWYDDHRMRTLSALARHR